MKGLVNSIKPHISKSLSDEDFHVGVQLIKVKVHAILGLKQIIGQSEVEISIHEGSSLQELVSLMVERWGTELSSRLFDSDGTSLLPYNRIMVNGRDLTFLDGIKTVLHDQDEIHIIPPVAGG